MPKRTLTCLVATALAATGVSVLAGGATNTATAATTDDTPGYSVTAITVPVKVGPDERPGVHRRRRPVPA